MSLFYYLLTGHLKVIMNELILKVNIKKQELYVYENNLLCETFRVSTAKKGVGEYQGSEGTPRGWHVIRAKIGANCPVNTVFSNRRPIGRLFSFEICTYFPEQIWILTRILWLSGLEIGKNRLGAVDTMRRYIYIHGVPDDVLMGIPGSQGCICMNNKDIVKLFDWVNVGTRVFIEE